MAINKKNFRKIIVGDETFYWKVSPDQWMMRLFITNGDNANSNLNTWFDQEYIAETSDVAGVKSQLTITPKIVGRVIEYGRHNGWSPGEKGKDVSMEMPDKIQNLWKTGL